MTSSIHNDVLRALRRVIRATELDSKKLARQTGLTTSQLLVLDLLAAESELMVGSIASRVGLAQGTVTTIVDRLEALGLVKRQRGDADRRQVNVRVTEAGRELALKAPIVLQTRFLKNFAELRDWEKHGLLAALQRLADLMDAEGLDASPVLGVGTMDRSTADDPGD
jgi:DNA-binding MarR family transcriptional regulator